jgi:hypothetical protein
MTLGGYWLLLGARLRPDGKHRDAVNVLVLVKWPPLLHGPAIPVGLGRIVNRYRASR